MYVMAIFEREATSHRKHEILICHAAASVTNIQLLLGHTIRQLCVYWSSSRQMGSYLYVGALLESVWFVFSRGIALRMTINQCP